jgi:RNA polymerase sigma-70 factor (ECF subfamily)
MESPQIARLTTLEEGKLIKRVLSGDSVAFDELCHRYFAPLFRFALSRLDYDRELTRDIVQSTVTKAIRRLSSFRGEASFFTWLCTCCRNEISDHFRRRGRAPLQLALDDIAESHPASLRDREQDDPERVLMRDEARQMVHETLDELPHHYGKALEWKYLDGLTVVEIGERLQVSAKAAESILTRARNAFRKGFAGRAGGLFRTISHPLGG